MRHLNFHPIHLNPRALFARHCLMPIALLAGACGHALAQDAAAGGPPPGWVGPPPGWSGGVLAGAGAAPDFEGSRTQRGQPVLGFAMTYRNQAMGSLEMGSRGLAWTPVQGPDAKLTIGTSLDPGRVDNGDKKLTVMGYRPGNERLQGLGEIDAAPVLSVGGAFKLAGLPLAAELRHAFGSHDGTQLDLGLKAPWKIGSHVDLSIAPAITWADRRYMQAFFGVTSAQAAASRYAAYDARSGLKSAQLTVDMDMALSRWWHVNATVQAKRLLQDAADSPITEKTTQVSGMVAVLRQFQL